VLRTGTLSASSATYITSTAYQNALCVTGTSSYLPLIDPTITSCSGFGVGLAIAGRAVHLHGGKIRALPREGGGLTIEVRLPAQDRVASAQACPYFSVLPCGWISITRIISRYCSSLLPLIASNRLDCSSRRASPVRA